MEDRDRLPGEEGIQNKDLFTVLRHPSALLRRSMHHAQFPERIEADSARYRASTEVPYRRGYRETPKSGHRNNIPLRAFYAKIAHYNRYRMLELRSRLAEV